MNDQDRDLILALVAGDLEGADAEVALARIEADPDLMAAFAAQRTAIDALAAVPPATLTASERTSLRESLVGELHLTAERPVAPVPAPAPRRRVSWWQPMVGVAAAAVFVTAVIVVPEMISGGADGGTAALEELPETTVAVVSDGAGFEEDMGTAGGGDAGGGADPAETAEVMTFSPEVDGADLLDATEGETSTESIDDALGAVAPRALPQRSTLDITMVEDCLERLDDELPVGDKTVLGVEPIDGGVRVFLAVDPGTGVDAVVSIDLPACTLADVDE